jgi:ribosomal protein S8E
LYTQLGVITKGTVIEVNGKFSIITERVIKDFKGC